MRDFEHYVERLLDLNVITDKETLLNFAIENIHNGYLFVAIHILSAIEDDDCEYYIYDYSMGTLETPSGVKCIEDIEHLIDDME